VALYLAAMIWRLNVPNLAEDGGWNFDPLAWQLIFFVGFALRRGWISVRLCSPPLMTASAGLVGLGIAVSLPIVTRHIPAVGDLGAWLGSHADKTYLDPIRLVHFLAVVYLTLSLLQGRARCLLSEPLRPVVKCGQQALSIFISGMVLSHVGGIIFDHIGN